MQFLLQPLIPGPVLSWPLALESVGGGGVDFAGTDTGWVAATAVAGFVLTTQLLELWCSLAAVSREKARQESCTWQQCLLPPQLSSLLVDQPESPIPWGQPAGLAGWHGVCCTSTWHDFWMGESPRGSSDKSGGASPSEERSVFPQASCSLAFLLLSLCSSRVGLLSTKLSVYMEWLKGICHESVANANRANQESWLVGEKTLTL